MAPCLRRADRCRYPATGEQVGTVAKATRADLAAADAGFKGWAAVSAYERSKITRRAADILPERKEAIAVLMMREQGKPFAEALGEVTAA